jgi:hypothetical protein
MCKCTRACIFNALDPLIPNRRSREFYWQLTLGTIFPSGLNAFPVDLRDRFTRLEMYNIKDLELFWTLVCLQNDVPEDSD